MTGNHKGHGVAERITLLVNGQPIEVDSFRVDVTADVSVAESRLAPASWEGTFVVDEVSTLGQRHKTMDFFGWWRPPTRYWARRAAYWRRGWRLGR